MVLKDLYHLIQEPFILITKIKKLSYKNIKDPNQIKHFLQLNRDFCIEFCICPKFYPMVMLILIKLLVIL